MPIKSVVVNASPIICLSKAGLIDLLPKLFYSIIIPREVVAEVGIITGFPEGFSHDAGPTPIIPDSVSAWDLGKGESAVITWCLSDKSRWAILDDREACRCADTLGCYHTGTIGILLLAKKAEIVTSVTPFIHKLSNSGLWMSERFINEIIRSCGE
ncbi:MAG: DUF3368 domain-containing protein [Fibrobacteres bacterium]|nr:DUF3368 domain-containing protein [Fibrobacterota bacterium]